MTTPDTKVYTQYNASSFAVGELLYLDEPKATFQVVSTGRAGLRVRVIHTEKDQEGHPIRVVPAPPFTVVFKNIKLKVVGFSGKEFTLHNTD